MGPNTYFTSLLHTMSNLQLCLSVLLEISGPNLVAACVNDIERTEKKMEMGRKHETNKQKVRVKKNAVKTKDQGGNKEAK